MLNKAIEKIKAETESNKNNSYVQVVGSFLIQHIQVNPNDAEKIVLEGKTIKGSLEEMKKLAKAKAVGGCGMFAPQEGFEIVLKYFGIEGAATINISNPIKVVEDPIAPIAKETKSNIGFNVELDF